MRHRRTLVYAEEMQGERTTKKIAESVLRGPAKAKPPVGTGIMKQ